MLFNRFNLLLFIVCHIYVSTIVAEMSYEGTIHQSYFSTQDAQSTDAQIDYFQHESSLIVRDTFWDARLNINYQTDPVPTQFFMSYTDADKLTGAFNVYGYSTQLRLGHVYDSVGHGIVFRASRNRALLIDNNLYGYVLTHNHALFSAKYVSGKMRNSIGERSTFINAGEFVFYPFSFLSVGATAVSASFDHGDSDLDSQSFLMSLEVPLLSIDVELGRGVEASSARYISITSQWESFTQSYDYVSYSGFSFHDKEYALWINQGPLAIQEHGETLLARQLPLLDMSSQESFNYVFSYDLSSNWQYSVSYSRYDAGGVHYEDSAIKQTFYNTLFFEKQVLGYAMQTLNKAFYSTWIQSSHLSIMSGVMLDWTTQLQTLSNDKTWLNELTITPTDGFSIGGVLEYDEKEDKHWFSWIMTLRPSSSDLIQAYVGSFRAGKLCSGGLCIYQPEFDGVKVDWKHSF